MTNRTTARALALPVLLAALPLAARAQAPVEATPVSVSATNAPVTAVLRSLFKGAGIRSFVIDSDVQGSVNADLSAVPFPVALKQVLASVAVPLTFSVESGVYHVSVKAAGPTQIELPVSNPPASATLPEDAGQSHFYKIGIKHYDPGVIAELLTHQTGLIDVPPNFVIPSGGNASSALSGPAVTTVRPPSAFGPAVPLGGTQTLTGPQAAPAAANSVLPDGVKRIFVRHSDNSLVVEATPEGMARLLPQIKETNP